MLTEIAGSSVLPSRVQSISTGSRQQIQVFESLRSQNHALRLVALTVFIVGAATRVAVQVFTANIGIRQLSAVLVLELDHTAAAAAVAQVLPFPAGKIL